MVKWQEVGRVISAVHHHGGNQGLKTSEIQKLVRQHPQSTKFNFKEALDEAVRSGFLTVRNRRFYPCSWQELVSTRKRGSRLPRGRQVKESLSTSRSDRSRGRSRRRSVVRKKPSRSYARRRNKSTRRRTHSSYSRQRRRRSPRPRTNGRKTSVRRKRARGLRQARAGSDEKIASDGNNRVTPAEHATGKKYPPQ